MLAVHDHIHSAAAAIEAARRAQAWRRQVWGRPQPTSASAPAAPPPSASVPTVKLPTAPQSTTRRLVKAILGASAERYGLKVEDLLGRSRLMNVAHARQIAMYLCRNSTPLSLPRIGAIFGRDHTTVLHGCRAVTSSFRLVGVAEEIAAAAQAALAAEEDRGAA
jgi:hypothetical protein